ncbi:MAG: M48 family metalloprotease [Deltaproteobacteria bacterium]|jgi:Zn-dependent protease with chaperone function|nr:M48 family metalloprotease [Deltaproteobacteria bacterium]
MNQNAPAPAHYFDRQKRSRLMTKILAAGFVLSLAAVFFAVSYGLGGVFLVVDHLSVPHVFTGPDFGAVPSEPIFYRPSFFLGAVSVLAIIFVALMQFRAIRDGGSTYIASLLKAEPFGESVFFRQPLAEKQGRMVGNIVAEMSLAASMSEPDVYILLNDETINAMACGIDEDDLAVVITKGALRRLDREEMSALLAHEFSHLVNGDTRLFTYMVGYLAGLFSFHNLAGFLAQHYPNLLTILISGVCKVVGLAATLSGKILQAAVARSREDLADASAVQYTRDPMALAGVLKKIGGQSRRTERGRDFPAVNHFFLVNPDVRALGSETMSYLFSLDSHPPLGKRILALDPGWDGKFWDYAANPVDYLSWAPKY